MEKAEYLRRYLGIGRIIKPKKKKEAKVVGRGLRIIDDDADFCTLNVESGNEEGDEKPIVIESPKREVNLKLTNKNWFENSEEDPGKNAHSRRQRHDSSDSDISPPINKEQNLGKNKSSDADEDLSPPRNAIKKPRHDSDDSDISPPRMKTLEKSKKMINKNSSKNQKDVDLSPPRRNQNLIKSENIKSEIKMEAADNSPPRRRRRNHSSSPGNSPPRSSVGRFQQPVKRDISKVEVISRHNNEKEKSLNWKKQKKEEEEGKKEALNAKYAEWGRGLKQGEQRKEMLEDIAHEANKPLARYEDDDDLNDMRKKILLREDPMYNFIQQKQQSNKKNKKVYSGPDPHPNRFNIPPGYRWDGVDRSNDFEKEFFQHASNKKAVKDIAYKYMTEDM